MTDRHAFTGCRGDPLTDLHKDGHPASAGRCLARRDAGMVTAETAASFPALALVLAVMLGAFDVAVTQVRCIDAASSTARAVARGDPPDRVRRLTGLVAPDGSSVSVHRTSGAVTVTVTAPASRLARLLPLSLRPSARATAADETAAPGAGWTP